MKASKMDDLTPPLLTSRAIIALLQEHEDALKQFTVKRIGLFGSYVSGKQTPKSDLDFVVDFAEPTFDNFMELVDYLEGILGKSVNVLTLQGLQSVRVPRVAESIKRSVRYV